MCNFKEDFQRYLRVNVPILYIDTFENDIAFEKIKKICGNDYGIIEWKWNRFKDYTMSATREADLEKTLSLLMNDKKLIEGKMIVLNDVHFYFDGSEIVSALKVFAQGINDGKYSCNICIIAPLKNLPQELDNYTTILELDFSDEEMINFLIEFSETQGIKLDKNLAGKFATYLKGLPQTKINEILSLTFSNGGKLDDESVSIIFEQKRQLIKKVGILEMVEVKENLDNVGGLENLKSWLKRKSEIFNEIHRAKKFGVDIPKGVMIVGMPGCGKSLTAKAAAKSFNVPLLKMDMGRLMGKYVGESEANMRRAIKLAESVSPCILWIDEIEKAFAGTNSNGGSEITTRLFGNFLTWMQEKTAFVFVVATANNIIKLPPEFLRRGRFDEIFYVDLPNVVERKKILEIHIKKRRPYDLQNIDLQKLAEQTSGYCGADLEGAIKDAVETAFVEKKSQITTEGIVQSIKNSTPISMIMKDSIKAMQEKYKAACLKSAS